MNTREHITVFISCIRHSKDEKGWDNENPEKFYLNFVTQYAIPITMSLSQIMEASANDSETQSLLKAIRTGKWYEQPLKHYEKMNFNL